MEEGTHENKSAWGRGTYNATLTFVTIFQQQIPLCAKYLVISAFLI